MRRFISLCAVLLFLIVPSSFAADLSSPSPACGATVTEGMRQVKQALAVSDNASQHRALVCLAEVVAAMNDKIAAVDAEVNHAGVNHVDVPVPYQSVKVKRQ